MTMANTIHVDVVSAEASIFSGVTISRWRVAAMRKSKI